MLQVYIWYRIYRLNQFLLMSDLMRSRTAQHIEAQLQKEQKLMMVHEKNCNYVDAEGNRRRIEQLKKDLDERLKYELEAQHRRQSQDMLHTQQNEFNSFNNMWNKKLADIEAEGVRSEQQLANKHQRDQEATRRQLEEHFPHKVKESSQCLNLRKMEEHMAKQKNFVEAHRVQQILNDMEKKEKDEWLAMRNNKIQTALSTLRVKQDVEMKNLKKRTRTLLDEESRDRNIEEQRLRQKYNNILNQLKSQHDKETLAHQGQFKSKGGPGSPLKTKSFLLVK